MVHSATLTLACGHDAARSYAGEPPQLVGALATCKQCRRLIEVRTVTVDRAPAATAASDRRT